MSIILNTYSNVKDFNPLKVSGAISVILLLSSKLSKKSIVVSSYIYGKAQRNERCRYCHPVYWYDREGGKFAYPLIEFNIQCTDNLFCEIPNTLY